MDNPAAMMGLITILQRYDLMLLMEIRDASGEAQTTLIDSINAVSEYPYELILSKRLGRTSYKEQYGLLYRPDKVQVHSYFTYDDGIEPHQDLFEREPLVAYIEIEGVAFNLIGLHADPEGVPLELNRLQQVYNDAVLYTGDPDAILLGDLNADCSYLLDSDAPYINLLNDPDFIWMIEDSDDTTTSQSHCAYDRIIVTADLLNHQLPNVSANIYDFQTDLNLNDELTADISNHYPVELEFSFASQ